MKNSQLFGVLLCSLAAQSAFGAQISLAPANVIGNLGVYGATFTAGEILDQQTGPISEASQSNYWLNSDNGPINAFITIDLLAAYRIGSFELFNTHNANYNDRGTGAFRIRAGNSVVATGNGFELTGTTAVLVNNTLQPVSQVNDPIDSETFSVSNNNLFRYLMFEPLSVSVGGSPCCGTNVYGLNELRVFDAERSSVPEPGTFSLMGGCAIVLWYRARRRR